MAASEPAAEFDPKIAVALDEALRRLREEFLERLRAAREEILRQLAEAVARTAPAPASAAEPVAEAAAAGDRLAELREAVALMDRAPGQAEVLQGLLDAAGRFASRTALFLTLPGEIRGWSSAGFAQAASAIEGVVLRYEGGSPWIRLAEGKGTVRLSAAECARLCASLGVPAAGEGLLIPFVLRDRVAAALYADGAPGDGAPDLAALQLLTFIAAQAIEVLPFRRRPGTATLRLREEAPPDERGLEIWDPEAVAAATVKRETEREQEVAPLTASAPAEPPGATLPPPEPEMAPEPAETTAVEAIAAEEFPPEPTLAEPEPEAMAAAPEPETAPSTTAAPQVAPEAWAGEPEPEPAERPWEAPAVPFEEQRWPPPGEEPEAAAGAAAAAGEPAPETLIAERASTGVVPPLDVEGPGLAFSRLDPARAAEEALFDEARRLARLLVSEIRLYNEDEVQEGRRQGDIVSRLGQQIERSRQIYDERVDPRVRARADYFHEELVRILAAGDPALLGR